MWRILVWDPAYALESPPLEGEVQAPWRPLEEPCAPIRGQGAAWPPLYFVDGRERVDALLSDGKRLVLLGSLAVGAVVWREGRMALAEVQVERYAVGAEEGFRFGALDYRPLPLEGAADPQALLKRLQEERAHLEATLAQGLGEGVVVTDGPLRVDRPQSLGYIKAHWARYLPEEAQGLLALLGPGERTPAFLLSRRGRQVASWYLRLPLSGAYPPGAGLLRVEAPLEGFQKMAELSLSLFPALASHPAKDPRAPQNLLPVGGLERELGRRMGSREVVGRKIAQFLGGGT